MPITKSAIKALRKDNRKKAINKPIKKHFKIKVALARKDPSLANLKKAYSALDKAAKGKIIHKNKASRLKSRLAKLLHQKTKK